MSQSDDVPETEVVVWDLASPTRPTDLGSSVDRFVEVDGPATIDVTFPSGRRVIGTFERGGLAEADSNGVINQVTLLSVIDSPEDLRAEINAFIEEWGPIDGEVVQFIEQYEAAFSTDTPVTPDDFGGVGAGRSVRRFDADEQEGVTPSIGVRVTEGVMLRWSLRFDPVG